MLPSSLAALATGFTFLTGLPLAAPAQQIVTFAQAAPAKPAATVNRSEALARANASLNRITTAQGRFYQIDPSGSPSEGEFYLRRPGRLRFEYADPTPLLIVSDGTTVAIEDRDLETVDRVPLGSTPLSLILRENADLSRDANILGVDTAGDFVIVRISDKSGEAEGELALVFDSETYALQQWETTDGLGQVTTVRLTDVTFGERQDPRLFRLEFDEDEDRRR